jgi:hypothetical protein
MNSKCSILSSSPNVESNAPVDAPYFDSFLVLEVRLLYFHLLVSDQCQRAVPVTTNFLFYLTFVGVRKTQR